MMLVPSQNPDGVDIVGDWYRSTLGTPAEGSGPPALYHHYTGHDNNRDWYAFTQVETRYIVDSLYTPWDPGDRQRHPPAGRQCGPDLHPALHGSGGAQHRSDPHRGHQLARDGDGVADDRRRKDRHGDQRLVRPVVAGAPVLPQPPRRPDPDRDGERPPGDGVDVPFSAWGRDGATMRGSPAGTIRRCGPAGPGRSATSSTTRSAPPGRSWSRRPATGGLAAELCGARRSRPRPRAPLAGRDACPSAYLIPKAQPDRQALHRLLWTLAARPGGDPGDGAAVTAGERTYPAGSYAVVTAQPFGATPMRCWSASTIPTSASTPAGRPRRRTT